MTYLPANVQARSIHGAGTSRSARAPAIFGPITLAIFDIAAIWLGFYLAYVARYRLEIGGDVFVFNQREFSDFYGRVGLFTLFCMAIFLVRGVYRQSAWTSLLDEMGLLAGSLTIAMGGLILTAYLSQFSPSRLLFVFAWVFTLGLLFLVRIAAPATAGSALGSRYRSAACAHCRKWFDRPQVDAAAPLQSGNGHAGFRIRRRRIGPANIDCWF